MIESRDPWVVLSLPPAAPERVRGWFAGLDLAAALDLRFPRDRTRAAVLDAVDAADIILSDWSGALHVGPEEVERASRLSFLMSPAVGLDSIDLPALTAHGVVVANTAGRNAASVAEWCLAAALAVARSLAWVDREVRDGRWPQLELPERGSIELEGRRVGVVGFGAVGSRVARLFAGIGCDVSYWTRHRRPVAEESGATWVELDDLVAQSDILVVNIALTDETRGLLGAERLALLPRGAVVVDASRGGITDHDALAAMVEAGFLRGAAVDVFETEPLPPEAAIRRSDRILLSSHAAATTAESIARIFGLVGANVGRAIRGEPVESIVNGLGPIVQRRVADTRVPR